MYVPYDPIADPDDVSLDLFQWEYWQLPPITDTRTVQVGGTINPFLTINQYAGRFFDPIFKLPTKTMDVITKYKYGYLILGVAAFGFILWHYKRKK